jgi:hypothetical protein
MTPFQLHTAIQWPRKWINLSYGESVRIWKESVAAYLKKTAFKWRYWKKYEKSLVEFQTKHLPNKSRKRYCYLNLLNGNVVRLGFDTVYVDFWVENVSENNTVSTFRVKCDVWKCRDVYKVREREGAFPSSDLIYRKSLNFPAFLLYWHYYYCILLRILYYYCYMF